MLTLCHTLTGLSCNQLSASGSKHHKLDSVSTAKSLLFLTIGTWTEAKNLSEPGTQTCHYENSPTQWRALYHSTGIWLYYGIRLLWIGSGWDSLWAEIDGLCGLWRRHTHITCCQYDEKLTMQTNTIQASLCSAKKWTGEVNVKS